MAYRSTGEPKGSVAKHDQLIQTGRAEVDKIPNQAAVERLETLDKAIACFSAALEFENSPEAAFELGNAYLFKSDNVEESDQRYAFAKQAIHFFEQSLVVTGDLYTLVLLGQSHQICAENSTNDEQKCLHFDRAIPTMERVEQRATASEVDPVLRSRNLSALMTMLVDRANLASNYEDYYERAVATGEKLIELLPDDIGNAYNHQNVLIKAGIACIDGAKGKSWLERGEIANRELIENISRFDQSEPFFQEYPGWTPKNIEFDQVCVLTQLERYDEAVAHLQDLLESTSSISWERIDSDTDLNPLRSHPLFIKLRNSQTDSSS